ncbi:DUF19 domain-containing protein [Caenorhabditis elegans]|uniref:DUF19 domain-containing protein n=1 Tax=Caenorhabditis elegans TaxID=6239 RepID=E9P845_CAEEL|nr:DUF19 domain-containing protein [Caenorhabditis elegans]CCD72633.1 DUF19 domain-containing protein [Caenorhabditis elegans]|eukprot:NP_001257043.1 Uncharacterized protein CELE_K10C2.14 [Caenorhabditis elegans]
MLHSILAIFVLPVAVNAGLFDYGLTIMEMNLNSTYKCDNAQLQSKMEACVAPARQFYQKRIFALNGRLRISDYLTMYYSIKYCMEQHYFEMECFSKMIDECSRHSKHGYVVDEPFYTG